MGQLLCYTAIEKRCRIYDRYKMFIYKKLQLIEEIADSRFGTIVQKLGKRFDNNQYYRGRQKEIVSIKVEMGVKNNLLACNRGY
jgi:hypothetical protein